MKYLLFLLFIPLSQSCDQTKAIEHEKHIQDSITYIQKSIEFIKLVKGKEIQDSTFILVDQPVAFNYYHCLEQLLADSSTFSKEELSFIRQKKYPSVTHWTNGFFPALKLVSAHTIDSIFKSHSEGWNYFYKHFGKGFSSFSMPIFLRNDTYCIFYSDHSCGWLCGVGELVLYKLNNGNWEKVSSYCNWIS